MLSLFIPSPAEGVWYLGPLPLRGYALCIIAGIVAAVWIGERRWLARGGTQGEVTDIALWAVPFGVVGGRLYHVITDHDLYFGDGQSAINALYVWRGGLGIWGAIALGGLGVWIGARRKGIRVPPMLDALAPGVLIAQAMGRWGNWFNQELFGRPSTQPWALKIDPANRPPGYEQYATFQPTFLYESIWDVAAFFFVIWADRRFKLGHGRVMALYVMAYTLGRGWIETLRIDDVEYQHVLGMRLNVWTSIVLFVLATIYFVVVGRRHPGREDAVYHRAAAGGRRGRGGRRVRVRLCLRLRLGWLRLRPRLRLRFRHRPGLRGPPGTGDAADVEVAGAIRASDACRDRRSTGDPDNETDRDWKARRRA